MPQAPSAALDEWLQAVEERVAGLTADLAVDDHSPEAEGRRLLADLLDWHRREEKSQWWRYFELRDDLTIEQLVNERDALAGLVFVDQFEGEGVMLHRRYRFQPQDHGFDPGDEAFATGTGKTAGTIVSLDDVAGIIELKRSRNSEWPHPVALMGAAPLSSGAQKQAMLRVADAVIADGIDGDGAYRAVRDMLLRLAPRRSVGWGASLVEPGEDVLDAARRLALELDAGTLPIQGPPGTGKTYAGARMILDLVGAGKRVGVTAQSHKTISNMLEAVVEAATEERVAVRIIQKADSDVGQIEGVTRVGGNADVAAALAAGTVDVVAGTGWLFARPEFDGAFDVLFVDEASQMSLANAVALGTSARSIVLIGDQNQLPMVTAGCPARWRGRLVTRTPGRRRADDASRARSLPRDVAPDASGRERLHFPGVLRWSAHDAPEDRAPQRRWRRPRPVRFRAPAGCRRRTRATGLARVKRQRSSPRLLPV